MFETSGSDFIRPSPLPHGSWPIAPSGGVLGGDLAPPIPHSSHMLNRFDTDDAIVLTSHRRQLPIQELDPAFIADYLAAAK